MTTRSADAGAEGACRDWSPATSTATAGASAWRSSRGASDPTEPVGTFGWDGGLGTSWCVDPQRGAGHDPDDAGGVDVAGPAARSAATSGRRRTRPSTTEALVLIRRQRAGRRRQACSTGDSSRAGRLAAAMACPWRFSFSPGIRRSTRDGELREVDAQHLARDVEHDGAARPGGDAAEHQHVAEVVDGREVGERVAEVDAERLVDVARRADRPPPSAPAPP